MGYPQVYLAILGSWFMVNGNVLKSLLIDMLTNDNHP